LESLVRLIYNFCLGRTVLVRSLLSSAAPGRPFSLSGRKLLGGGCHVWFIPWLVPRLALRRWFNKMLTELDGI
jgi:hypothetical protein